MPDCVRANINATTMVIGERIAYSHLREQRSAIMADESLHWKAITEVAGLIESMQVSPVDVTTAKLDRIEDLDGRFKSYATVMADSATTEARSAEREIAGGRYIRRPCKLPPKTTSGGKQWASSTAR